MINLILAPITYTKDKLSLADQKFQFENDFEEIREKHKENYLFKSEIDYGVAYFVLADNGILHIRIEPKSDHVYDDLVLLLKEEYPAANYIKLIPAL